MADAADFTGQINSASTAPQSAEVDGLKAQAVSIPDLIAGDRYLNGKAAARLPGRGLRITKMIPPGPVSDNNGTSSNLGGV